MWMALIFYMSSQPANDSKETSHFVVDVLFKIFFSNNYDRIEFIEKYTPLIRKMAHFTEFMILGILFYINLEEFKVRNALAYAMVLSSLYAVSDEIHQLFVLNRHCSIGDMLIDISGAVAGIILIHLFKRWKN